PLTVTSTASARVTGRVFDMVGLSKRRSGRRRGDADVASTCAAEGSVPRRTARPHDRLRPRTMLAAVSEEPTEGRDARPGDGRREYRIGELAEAAGLPVRTLRYYQERRLLPPPRREGRVGLYSE